MIRAVAPDVIINRPHGRLVMGGGESGTRMLRELNVPILAPVTVSDLYENWLTDRQGMASGGMTSMSIVMPELDGAVAPYAVAAQFERNGMKLFDAIPVHTEKFCSLVEHYARLHDTPNSEKKVAIYYYKGAGKGCRFGGRYRRRAVALQYAEGAARCRLRRIRPARRRCGARTDDTDPGLRTRPLCARRIRRIPEARQPRTRRCGDLHGMDRGNPSRKAAPGTARHVRRGSGRIHGRREGGPEIHRGGAHRVRQRRHSAAAAAGRRRGHGKNRARRGGRSRLSLT